MQFLEEHDRKRWIANRLKVGEIVAVARTAYLHGRVANPFFGIPALYWESFDYIGDDFFWDSGDVTLRAHRPRTIPPEATYQCHDVRFDPQGFSGVQTKVRPVDLDAGEPAETKVPRQELPQLSRADAERFCHAMLAGWPDSGQDFAHEKAVLFFPDNRVPRDWFRSILRSIRGTVKPGKKPKPAD